MKPMRRQGVRRQYAADISRGNRQVDILHYPQMLEKIAAMTDSGAIGDILTRALFYVKELSNRLENPTTGVFGLSYTKKTIPECLSQLRSIYISMSLLQKFVDRTFSIQPEQKPIIMGQVSAALALIRPHIDDHRLPIERKAEA